MERIIHKTHSKDTFLYALSRAQERASYYGLRSLIVLYMVGENLKMERTDALSVYGWFVASFLFSKIIGGILGDLLIGNKITIIIGGILQALGAFSFCIQSTMGLYLGLFLIVLGGGLYTPNIISNFGKLYLNRLKLLDAGLLIFYLSANLGAFFGVMLMYNIRNEYGWNMGFIVAGILMLLSTIPIIISKDKKNEQITRNKVTINQRITDIIIVFVTVSLFWFIYEIGNIRIIEIQSKLSEISTLDISKTIWNSLNSVFIFPMSILAISVWTFFYKNYFFKLTIAFIFGVISFGILLLIPETPTESHTIIYLLSLLFLSISEIHISPIIHSVLTKNSNPKYLAILISLAFIPTRLFSMIFSMFSENFYGNPIFFLQLGLIVMLIMSIGLILFMKWKKKNYL